MGDGIHIGIDTLLGLGFGGLFWFVKRTFLQMEEKLDAIKSDDEILAIVNGKYQSRREVDLIMKDRDEWRANLSRRMEQQDDEIIRLRNRLDRMRDA